MDDIDRQLVGLLQENARMSYAELARQVGLTSPSVQERVAKLERNDVITAYRAEINPSSVGLDITALIGIVTTAGTEYTDVAETIRDIPEVESCYFTAGSESYLLKVRVGAMSDLEHLVNRLSKLPGVGGTRTTIALSTKWESRPQTGFASELPSRVDHRPDDPAPDASKLPI